jgi:2-dehydropantoate 2-reductase
MQRYVILGAGGIGCAVGGLLQVAGSRVVYVARGKQLDVLRERGLTLATPSVTHQLEVDARAGDQLRLAADDVVLLCTKSQDSAAALAAFDVRDTAVVSMQNGVANERLIAECGARAYAAMVYLPASFLAPGRVSVHASPCPGIVDVGCYPRGADAICNDLAADLRAAGYDSRVLDDVMRFKYAKLLSNLGNVLQALGGHDALSMPSERPLRKDVQAEAEAVLVAAGIAHASLRELYQRGRAIGDDPVEGQRRRGGSSWQSLHRGVGLETDYLNGEIVRLGEEHGVATPLNAGLVELAARATEERWPPEHLSYAQIASALARPSSSRASREPSRVR